MIVRDFKAVDGIPAAMPSVSLRWLPVIGLLALGSTAAFWLGRGEGIVALSAVCVLLIVGSLLLMFSRSPPPAAG